MDPIEDQDPDAPYRVGALSNPRTEDSTYPTWSEALQAAYELSQAAKPWDYQAYAIHDNRHCLRAIEFEGTTFTP